jgi:hypothetical protein
MSMSEKMARKGARLINQLMGGNQYGFKKITHPKKRVKTPGWMYDDKEIRSFLLREFPYLVEGRKRDNSEYGFVIPKETKRQQHQRKRAERQRKMAGRWGFMIKNFFTGTMSSRDIEAYLKHPTECKCVGRLIQRIRCAAEGLRQDGRPRTGKPRGRPLKLSAGTSPALNGGAGGIVCSCANEAPSLTFEPNPLKM